MKYNVCFFVSSKNYCMKYSLQSCLMETGQKYFISTDGGSDEEHMLEASDLKLLRN